MKKVILLFFLFLSAALTAKSQNPAAFPGAEGHGRYATGGRGGAVYYVTTLEDNNEEGSLRYAVNRLGTRTILFKVSGTIRLNSELKIANGNLTIAGQSAPGDGICLAGYPVFVNANNVIIRYIRCRMGDLKDVNADGADAMGGRKKKNVIIDHCSISWCTDECASFYENENFTMQWCLVSESLNRSLHAKGDHGYGAIWGGMKASFHHNLLAHHQSRVPRLGPGASSTPTNEHVDIRNNVYYNYNGEGCYAGEAMHVNIVNNYYKPGPGNTWNSTKKGRIIAIDKKTDDSYPAIKNVWGTFYIDGNVVAGHANATNDNWTYGVYNQIHSKYNITQAEKNALKLAEPLETNIITTHTAEKAYEKVLQYVGCSYRRDALDARIVEEARTNTANFKGSKTGYKGIVDSQQDLKPEGAGNDWSAWPVLTQETAPADSDNDGIPDGWLDANYPGKKSTDKNEEGYTMLEVYLNSLVADITEKQNEEGITSGPSLISELRPDAVSHYNRIDQILSIYSDNIISRVDIYTTTGTRMNSYFPSERNCKLNLSAVLPGIYLLQIFCEDYTLPYATKIIK